MEHLSNETLYQASINSDSIIFIKPTKKKVCCCITDQWCFEHSGIAGFNNYDEDKNNCCTCLDCCTWCLEFKFKKPLNCIKDTNCYICCFAIYFT
jgi:hypothetical protein